MSFKALSQLLGLSLALSRTAFAAPSTVTRRDAFPDFVLTYAPLAHIHSEDRFQPSEITTHLENVTPQVDFENVADAVTLADLNGLGTNVFLTSKDNIEDYPEWLLSTENKPDDSGLSSAPATIIVVEKEGGITDAFYFYFFSYNQGNTLFGTRYGDHVGDWEHSMVRFQDGQPVNFYLSAHSGGFSYTWEAPEKQGDRPVHYIANGSHANYATAGKQPYTLPFGLLADNTDAGPLWDPTLNFRGYFFDAGATTFTPADGAGSGGEAQASETVDWLYWLGRWGDEQYPDDDPDHDQYCPLDIECHYVTGPTGPLDKHLDRANVCPDDDCDILNSTDAKKDPVPFESES